MNDQVAFTDALITDLLERFSEAAKSPILA